MGRRYLTIAVDGLSRPGKDCAPIHTALETALAREPGILRVHVNGAMETLYVSYDPALINPERIVLAITRAGLHATKPSVREPLSAPQRSASRS